MRWTFAGLLFLAMIGVAAAEQKRVLLLHSFGRDFAPWGQYGRAIREELGKESTEHIDIFEASLATARYAGDDEGPFVDYLRALFLRRPLDLIVTVGAPAASFFQRHRTLFPSVPALYTALEKRRVALDAITANDAVVATSIDHLEVVERFLRLRPETTNIVLVIGNSPIEKYWQEEVRNALRPLEGRVALTWFNELSFEEMLKRAATLPPNSAIFFLLLSVDAAGVAHEELKSLERLHAVSNAPILSYDDSFFGHGIVGGPMNTSSDLSRQAASVAVRILRGESAGSIKTSPVGFGKPKYDWGELQRWNISEANLPADSKIYFREPTLWERYRWQLSTAFAIVLFQAALIGWLFFERQRRRVASALAGQAHLETGRYRENLAHLARVHTVGEMSTALAHEINQPLVAIKNYALAARRRLARAEPLETGKVDELLDKIGVQASRAGDVLQSLRTMVKKHESAAARTELGKLIADTLMLVEMENSDANIRVVSAIPSGLPWVFVDGIQIQQVVLNLMRNAIDAIRQAGIDGGVIHVGITQSGDTIAVSVADQGPGIAPADVEHIFDPFYSTKGAGLGVGLSICRAIVEAHGGILTFTPNEGSGCIFRFTLPVANGVS